MAQQRPKQERRRDEERQQPVRDVRKIFPDRQSFPVVDIESDQHHDIRQAHSRDVQPDPMSPAPSKRRTAKPGAAKGTSPQNEQVIIFAPAHDREKRRGGEQPQQAPEIDRAEPGVAPPPLPREHRKRPSDNAGDPERDMHADDHGEESWIGRGNGNSRNDGRVSTHAIHSRRLTFGRQFNIR